MLYRSIATSLAFVIFALAGGVAVSQEKKDKQTGKLVGEIKSSEPTKNGKNTTLKILAPGEEKAREYRVQYDPKVKGPMPKVLEAVRAAKVGDRVQIEWINTGEGLAITAFEVIKSASEEKKK